MLLFTIHSDSTWAHLANGLKITLPANGQQISFVTGVAVSYSRLTVSDYGGVTFSPTTAAGKVEIPPTLNGTAGEVTIPKQTTTEPNSSASQGKQNNATTPFVLMGPSYSSPFSRVNKPLQPPPIANPGPNQVVNGGSAVILNGSNSRSPGGIILSYSWRQIPTSATISLSGASTPIWEFAAPNVSADTLLRFQLNVTDNLGQTGTAIVNVLDKPSRGPILSTPSRALPQIIKSPYTTESIQIKAKHSKGMHPVIASNFAPVPPPLVPPINPRLSPQAYNGVQSIFRY